MVEADHTEPFTGAARHFTSVPVNQSLPYQNAHAGSGSYSASAAPPSAGLLLFTKQQPVGLRTGLLRVSLKSMCTADHSARWLRLTLATGDLAGGPADGFIASIARSMAASSPQRASRRNGTGASLPSSTSTNWAVGHQLCRYMAVIPSYSCRDRCGAEGARPVPIRDLSTCSKAQAYSIISSRPIPRASPPATPPGPAPRFERR